MTPEQAKVLADHLQSLMSEEDAADVAKWARNPEAVRELLGRFDPYVGQPQLCAACLSQTGEPHKPTCRVFLAWAALDDPRAAEAIGAAVEAEARELNSPHPEHSTGVAQHHADQR